MPRNLVTRVATRLMEATAATVAEVNEQVLAELVEHLRLDCALLRHNAHELRVSKLVAMWPPPLDSSIPDPTAVAHFSSADPVLSLCEHGKKLTVVRPAPSDPTAARWIATFRLHWGLDAGKITAPSAVAAPLISGGVTTGQLVSARFKKKWRTEELYTIQTVASLLAQLQARIAAEAELRKLAEHDDLTGLHNRRALKEVGVQIAIDDSGTGYAVLSHLKSLPVDILEIDTSFVRDLGASSRDEAIVRAIVGLAEALDLQLVAKGVETGAAALTLMRHGCPRAQGFFLSRPLPGNAMESLLSSSWMPIPFLADRQALSSTMI